MMGEMQADLKAALAGCKETESWIRQVLDDLTRHPLPAPALTEEQVIGVMCADTRLAATVLIRYAADTPYAVKMALCEEIRESARRGDAHPALQSLAFALAAASYRG